MTKTSEQLRYPCLGFGVGLRTVHYEYILENLPEVDWFEFITEDFFVPGGRPYYYLESIREHYPLVMHGVSMSIGSCDPLNWDYLQQLKNLKERIKPAWVSDHLCWTGVGGSNMHDLLPLPYTEESVRHIVARVKQVQDFLGERIALENVSSYVCFRESEMTEWDFVAAIAKEADCLILLDINNIYVSAYNHHFDAEQYIAGIPPERVQQYHIAGHSNMGGHIIDTHDHDVIDEVWQLYGKALQRFTDVSTLLERDDHIPELPQLLTELAMAKKIAAQMEQVVA